MAEKKLMGYPSIDKPWMKYYSEEAINAPIPQSNLYDFMYSLNKDHPADVALNYFGTKVTYRELFEQIDIVAKAFMAQGVKPGDVCTIVTLSCVPSVLCLYALNRIGAVSNYINVLSTQADLEVYFRDADSDIIVTLDLFADNVVKAAKATGAKKVIAYSLAEWMPPVTKLGFSLKMRKLDRSCLKDPIVLLWKEFVASAKGQPEITFRKSAETLCCLAHTGGTTGFPKTVLINDRALNIVVQQYDKTVVHERQQVFLSVMIPFVIYGILTNIHMPLCLGLRTVLIPKFDASDWADYFKKYHPQHLSAIPAYVAPMLENAQVAKMDLSGLITVGLGGDGLNISLEERVNAFLSAHGSTARVAKGYGMTEVCATFSMCNNEDTKIGSVGFPFPTNNVMIYDNDLQQELSYNQVGEICLQSASRMMGYKDNEEEMRNLLHIHPDGSEWIHTGDLGYIDEDGFLFLEGRMKRIILTSSEGVAYKVFPHIPEEVLNRHSAVANTCIVGVSNGNDQSLKAYIVLNPETRGREMEIEEELRAACESELAAYMRPWRYVFREALPLTPAGKVDFRALEKDAENA